VAVPDTAPERVSAKELTFSPEKVCDNTGPPRTDRVSSRDRGAVPFGLEDPAEQRQRRRGKGEPDRGTRCGLRQADGGHGIGRRSAPQADIGLGGRRRGRPAGCGAERGERPGVLQRARRAGHLAGRGEQQGDAPSRGAGQVLRDGGDGPATERVDQLGGKPSVRARRAEGEADPGDPPAVGRRR
jgi:hypothetical protein